jgi:hypothetical protein
MRVSGDGWRQFDEQRDSVPASQEEAASQCRDCPECGGGGLTSRVIQVRPELFAPVSMYCHFCGAGRWLEQEHRVRHPELRKRIWLLWWHPEWWDEPRSLPAAERAPRDKGVRCGTRARAALAAAVREATQRDLWGRLFAAYLRAAVPAGGATRYWQRIVERELRTNPRAWRAAG